MLFLILLPCAPRGYVISRTRTSEFTEERSDPRRERTVLDQALNLTLGYSDSSIVFALAARGNKRLASVSEYTEERSEHASGVTPPRERSVLDQASNLTLGYSDFSIVFALAPRGYK